LIWEAGNFIDVKVEKNIGELNPQRRGNEIYRISNAKPGQFKKSMAWF
jgi:hypothetical protein